MFSTTAVVLSSKLALSRPSRFQQRSFSIWGPSDVTVEALVWISWDRIVIRYRYDAMVMDNCHYGVIFDLGKCGRHRRKRRGPTAPLTPKAVGIIVRNIIIRNLGNFVRLSPFLDIMGNWNRSGLEWLFGSSTFYYIYVLVAYASRKRAHLPHIITTF